MNGHLNTVFFGKIADLFRFQNTACCQHIRVDHGERAALQQGQERFLEVHIFPCPDGCCGGIGKTNILIRHLPGNRVFHPGKIEFFQTLRQFDTVFQRDMPQVVDGNGDLVTGHGATFRHVILQIIQPGFGNMDPCERVGGVEEVVRLAAHGTGINGAVGGAEHSLFVFPHFFKESQRSGEGTRHIHQQFDPKIHFQKGVALLHAIGKSFAHIASAALGIGVAVDPDPVTVFAAEELPHGHAPRLPRQVPQRHFDPAHAARLTGITAKLFDPAEDLFHVAGIFAKNTAFEHGGIGPAGGITHLAVTDQTLIGIDLDEGTALRGSVDIRKPDIGDFQGGGIDCRIHALSFRYYDKNCF